MSSEKVLEQSATYEIIDEPTAVGGRAIRCTVCYIKSYNPHDVKNRYCGSCRSSHNELSRRLQVK